MFILIGGVDAQRINLARAGEADGVASFLVDFGKAEAVFRRIAVRAHFQSNAFAFRVFHDNIRADGRELKHQTIAFRHLKAVHLAAFDLQRLVDTARFIERQTFFRIGKGSAAQAQSKH